MTTTAKKSIFFPSVSVGSSLTIMQKNIPHFVNGGSFRFGSKDSLFYYPYFLASAAHCFDKPDFPESIGFERDGLLFGDSGGFQLWAGSAKEGFNKEVALSWLNANANIFPIVDIPPGKTANYIPMEYVEDCAQKSLANGIYFAENRAPNKTILNVLHGRNKAEMDLWYSYAKQLKLDGWAGGGRTFTQVFQLILYLYEKGELNTAKYYHVFGVSKPRYIIFIIYLQKLLHELGLDIQITYDSSYPFKTSAFGNYFVYPTMTGIKNLKFSNRWDYAGLGHSHLPCECPYCKDVEIKEFAKFTTDRFYAICSFHNFYIMQTYIKMVQRIIDMNHDELLRNCLGAVDSKVLTIVKHYFTERSIDNRVDKMAKALEPIFGKYELEEEDGNEGTFGDMF